MPEQYIKPLQEKAKAIGLWLLDVPQEYGGAGLDLMSRCVIMEEVARTVAIPFRYAPIFGPEVRPVLFHCNEEQKKRFLLPVIRGEKRICFAQTEPDAGSDPAGMKTRAVETAIITSSMAPSASSPAPRTPITRRSLRSPIRRRARAAASVASSST